MVRQLDQQIEIVISLKMRARIAMSLTFVRADNVGIMILGRWTTVDFYNVSR
jgi:hypothetical protein